MSSSLMEINRMYNMDAFDGLKEVSNIGMTLTSPPYFGYSDGYTDGKKDYIQEERDFNKYIYYLRSIFKIIYERTREGGFCVLIYGDYGVKSKPYNELCYISKICDMMQEVGWKLIAQRIWHKKINPLSLNIINFHSSLSGRFRTTKGYEYILSFYKGELSIKNKEVFKENTIKDFFREYDLTLEEFKLWVPRSVWEINEKHPYDCYLHNKKSHNHGYRRIHPFQLPLPLLNRLIKIYSKKSDLILDPFAGSGTTLLCAYYLKRKFIGFEIEKKFVDYFEGVMKQIKKYEFADVRGGGLSEGGG